jgi:hypothetical protein
MGKFSLSGLTALARMQAATRFSRKLKFVHEDEFKTKIRLPPLLGTGGVDALSEDATNHEWRFGG